MSRYAAALGMLVACGGGASPAGDDVVTPPDAARADAFVGDGGSAGPVHDPISFTISSFNQPTWDATGVFLFSAPMGTSADNYAEMRASFPALIPAHTYNTQQKIWPSAHAHPPPYDGEETNLLAASGFHTGNVFHLADWATPQGIALALMLLPNGAAATGVTPDGELPMIANSLFPLKLTGELSLDATVVDMQFGASYPDSTAAAPLTVGYSHIPLFFTETTAQAPTELQPGEYSWHVKAVDATGAGFQVYAGPFYIEP